MDFDQLETFLEVACHASFSRAAEKRFRTQPAISSQIRALEEEVGARLFDRSGGKVSITAAGKLFQKYAEEMLEGKRRIIAAVAEIERVPRGEIVVGANEATCLHVLPEVFAEFKKQYPSVAVSINRVERAKILESVIDNSVDFGIVSMPVNDALPKVGRTRDSIEELCHQRRLKPNVSMELDSSELLKRFVAAGVGIGFIARSNVQEDVRAGFLAAIPMADAQLRRDLALVFRNDKALSRAALAFIEIAKKHKSSDVWTSR